MENRRNFLKISIKMLTIAGLVSPSSLLASRPNIESSKDGFRLLVERKSARVGARLLSKDGKHYITLRDMKGKRKYVISFNKKKVEKAFKKYENRNSYEFKLEKKGYKVFWKEDKLFTDYPDANFPDSPPPSSQFLGLIVAVLALAASVVVVFASGMLLDLFPPGLFKLEPDMEEDPTIWY